MGSLVLLLVVIAKQAQLQALETGTPDRTKVRKEINDELEAARLLAAEFDASREATGADLEDARFKLGQIEDHSGELRRQLESLETAWRQLDQLESGKKSTQQGAESELATLAIKIGQLEREVELARNEAAQRSAAYAIVPYEGPHGTRRRPIYIECRSDGLVLQPEGVYFGLEDFEGPLDAGNPLDVALRAVREYLTAQQSLRGSEESEPYPLMLVRPSGIAYFYAGRAAMKSWGTEFGYELVGEDWVLDYPRPDPALQRAIAEAVEPARVRQQRLIAAAPSEYGSASSRPVYTVTPFRGGVRSRGGSGGGEESSPFGLRPGGTRERYGNQYENSAAGPAQANQAGGPSREAGKSGHGASGGDGDGSKQPGGSSGSPREQSSGSSGGSGTQTGDSRDPSEASPPGRNPEAPQSLAKTRGRNWGLPDATQTAVAITRPIRVECHPDRIVIVPEAGLGQRKTVAVTGSTEASVDSFVSTVWDYMEGWGKAGRGMYWRPMLNVYVAPGAELRRVELEALLRDSGLLFKQAGELPASP